MYKKVFFEISGKCQAKCPHCCTGNQSLKNHASRFINVDDFTCAVDHLLNENLVDKDTTFELYNWGEPFLNPQLEDILSILVDRGIAFRLSTNGDKYIKLNEIVKKNLCELTMSIPGFSQSSYDRVHCLDFKKILGNIDQYIEDFGAEKIRITYLVHQFNIDEIPDAYNYFQKKKVKLTDTVAYLNDYNMARAYLLKELSSTEYTRITTDLLLYYLDDLLHSVPEDYECPQFTILSLDEYCNVLTCCSVPKGHPDYTLGSVFDLTAKDIVEGKKKRKVCKECSELGIHYWVHTAPKPFFWRRMTGDGITISDLIRILNRNAVGQFRALFNKNLKG